MNYKNFRIKRKRIKGNRRVLYMQRDGKPALSMA